MIIIDGYSSLIDHVEQDHAIALFKFFEQLPFTSVISFISVLLIALFFVTSSDSGSLVIDSLASGGARSEEHTSELQSRGQLVCRLLLEKKKEKPLIY